MKITVPTANLLKAVAVCTGIIESRTTLPVLGSLLITSTNNGTTVRATNLDQSIEATVHDVQVTQEGSVLLPGRQLHDILKNLTDAQTEVMGDSKKHTATITAGNSTYKLHGLAPDEFPPCFQNQQGKTVKFPAKILKEAFKLTTFAMSQDESRYILNGCLMEIKEDTANLIATDGRRLAGVRMAIEGGPGMQAQLVIPSKASEQLHKLLDTESTGSVTFDQNSAAFAVNGYKFATKLIEGNYPNYRQVIPTEWSKTITIPRKDLVGAVARAELVTSEKANSIKLHFHPSGQVDIKANSPDIGEAHESLTGNMQGSETAIAIQPRYLLEALKSMDQDNVVVKLNDELSPMGLLTETYTYICMPMRMS